MLRIGQVESSATADGKYTDGSVAGGIAATRLRAAAFNAIQEELANIVESAGMTLDPDDVTQVLAALKNQFLSRVNPFADIKADGSAAVAAALSNLQLSDGVTIDAVGRLVGITVVKSSQLYAKNPATKFAVIEVLGGGGAGGGSASITANATCSLGGGGTNGAYAKVIVLNPEDKTPIAIGSGGAAVSAATGNTGGTTSFGSISAPGGFGGNSMPANSTPAISGTDGARTVVDTSGADIVLISTPILQPGILGFRLSGTVGVSGAGGRSVFGDGGYARSAQGLPGIDGEAYGSGGGGAYSAATAGSPAFAGGNGAQGVVVIWEYA
ncbi:carbohydrate kinase [Kluyvera intermedia]|uniref:carbohydrate kinase n=1 Tax=Kluyvera intermedia TaxID=61648 RepID=UPI0039F6169B